MAFLPTNAAQVQQFAAAMYGIQVGTTTMAQVNADINAAGSLSSALNAYYNVSFGSATTAAVAASVAANLGLTGELATNGATYIQGQLDAAPATARGAVISNILNLFSTLSADATFGAAATAWNTKVESAVSYTGATDVVAGSTISVGTAFVFTDKIDALNGSANNDTFTGDTATVSNADTIIGGAGIDTVVVYGANGNDDIPSMSGVEVYKAVDVPAVNFSLSSVGVSTVHFKNPTTMDGSGTTAFTTGDTAVILEDVAGAEFIKLNTSTKTATEFNLTVDKYGTASTASAATVDIEGSVAAVKTLNITTTGTASVVTLDTSTAHSITKATIKGATALTLDVSNETSIINVDASAATGAMNVTQTAVTADLTFTGGSGNDRFNIGGNLSTADALNGGEGTDTLAISQAGGWSAASDAIVKAIGAQTSFEVLEVTDAAPTSSFDLSKVAYDSFKFSGALTSVLALTGTNSETVNFNTTSNVTAATARTTSGTAAPASVDLIDINPTLDNGSNSITLVIDGLTLTGMRGSDGISGTLAGAGSDALDVSPYETITIVSTGTLSTDANVIQGGDGGTNSSAEQAAVTAGDGLVLGTNVNVTITGANDLTIESVVVQNVTLNAAAFTGKLNVVINDATVDSNDVITGGTKDDTITAGDGIDTIDLTSGGSDTVNLDAVTESRTNGGNAAAITSNADRDIIKGFTVGSGTGADKLDLVVASADFLTTAITGTQASPATITTGKITEFAFEFSNNSADLAASTTGSELGKGIISGAAATELTTSDDAPGYIIAYDNGNAYVYYYDAGTGGNTTLTLSTEVKLVAVVEGVAIGGFAAANIA